MMPDMIHEAFGAEARQLQGVLAGLDHAAFARPSACDPWTVAELVCHLRMVVGRLPGLLAAPELADEDLVSAAGDDRADQRFSAATNADRIQSRSAGRQPCPGRRPGRAISA